MPETSKLADYAKWGTVMLGVITLAVSSYQFLRAKTLEREDQFNTYQLALYQEVAETAATMASATSQADRATASARFLALYWGEMVLVESREVEVWMSLFKSAYEGETTDGQPHAFIRSYAYCLTGALRNDLAATWDIDHWKPDRREPNGPDSCDELAASHRTAAADAKMSSETK